MAGETSPQLSFSGFMDFLIPDVHSVTSGRQWNWELEGTRRLQPGCPLDRR